MLAGALAGAALYIARQRLRTVEPSIVDWATAERIATDRLRRTPGSLPRAELRDALPSYQRAMETIVPLLENELGRPLPGVVEMSSGRDRATSAGRSCSSPTAS
jgi:hypothetical protein